MIKMKNSGIEWIGEIPGDWKVERLQWYIEEVKVSNNPMQTDRVLSLTNKAGVIPYEEKGAQGNVAKEDYTQYKLAYPNTIVANSMNILIGSVGICNYFGCVSPVYYVFKPTQKANLFFINYIMQTISFQKELRRYANGILEIRLRVSANGILKRKIAIPSFEKQKSVVDVINKKCAAVERLIENQQKQIEKLKEYKQSVITEAVTKGLDPSVPMKDSGIEWVGNIPSHWRVSPNKYLMKKQKDVCSIYKGDNVLSLTMKGVVIRDLDAGGKMPSSFDGYQKIKRGNLLMCLFDIDVTPRCVGLIECDGVTSPAYSQFIMSTRALASYYNYYYLMVDYTKELLHMAKNLRHSLTEDQFGLILSPQPPISEQQQIADYLDKKCAEIDKLISVKQQKIDKLNEYKKSLIYEYVTGKKEVG